jgi:hypothetical protein
VQCYQEGMLTLNRLAKYGILVLFFCISSLILMASSEEYTESKAVFDDQGTSFWSVYRNGTGTLSVAISNDTSIKQSGESSLKQVIAKGSYYTVGFYHIYEPTADWSAYYGLSFWVYGSNSKGYVSFVVFDKSGEDYLYIIRDDFSGWKQFTLDFSTCFKTGDVNLTSIFALEFAFSDPAPKQIYVDNLLLLGSTTEWHFPIFPWDEPSVSVAPTPVITPVPTQDADPTPTPEAPVESVWSLSIVLIVIAGVFFAVVVSLLILVRKNKKPNFS